jgi:hypothetical protein
LLLLAARLALLFCEAAAPELPELLELPELAVLPETPALP